MINQEEIDVLKKPVAVLAGTPVDTKMGADVLEAHGIEPMMYPVSRDPREQTNFQVMPTEEKHAVLRKILRDGMAKGCDSAFIYCNSLSGAVYFPALAEELGLRIVTPMDVYGRLAKKVGKLAIIAANAQGLAGQDSVMLHANPQILIMPVGLLQVVFDIEAGFPPEEIVRRNHLDTLMAFFEQNGCEALLLGCTHFPYLLPALKACTRFPIIDPAEEMVELLNQE